MPLVLCHASQIGGRQYLPTGLGEGLNAFMQDINRMGRSNDIALMMFENGDLKMTTDFRRVYATMIKLWMGYDDTHAIVNGDYAPLPIFG